MLQQKLPTYVKAILLALFVTISIAGIQSVSASSLCPSGYTQQQCYDYLIKIKNDLASQQSKIQNSIKQVQSQEGDIQSQVNQINAQIQSNEIELSQKQVDIELTSIDITNVGDQISDTKNHIDTLTQETQTASQKMNDITLMSYKMNSIPVWYLLAQNDLISTLEMLRYFDYVVQQEKIRLVQYTNLQTQLGSEEKVLSTAQDTVITKRDNLESDNLSIIQLRSTLSTQKGKQQVLLASLASQERALAAERSKLIQQMNAADNQATQIAIAMFEKGQLHNGTPVKKGDYFATEGYTGCSLGAHLHFGFISGTGTYTTNVNPFSSGLLSGSSSYLSHVGNASAVSPLAGAVVTQGFHDGMSLDMITYSAGNQDSSKKYQIVRAVCGFQRVGQTYNLVGWGAPLRAVLDGTVYFGTDGMGGRFAIIDHGNVFHGKKLKSIYWHLNGADSSKKLL